MNPTGKGGFKKGTSGNPSGRPRNSVSTVTRLRQAIEAEAGDIIARQIELAKKGSPIIARNLLQFILPPAKSAPLSVPLALTGSLADQAETVKAALAAAQITLEEGDALLKAIAAVQGIRDVNELAERVADLEERLAALAKLPAETTPDNSSTQGDVT